MAKLREAVGDIACPLCKRDAELHAFEERQKLDPDSDGGKPTYPKKFFVVCPPIKGYRGCGTILANGAGAQSQLMELGSVFGATRTKPEPKAHDNQTPVSPPVPPTPAAPKPVNNPFKLW